MKYSISNMELPCKLVLDDYQGFLDNAAKQGEANLKMAKVIADLGFVRVFGIGYANDGVTSLLNTGIEFNGMDIGLAVEELEFFTVHSAGF